jgi:hypothetical protein
MSKTGSSVKSSFIHRIICHRARVSDLPSDASTSVSVHDEIVDRREELGDLVSARSVGPFVVRLVRGRDDAADIWRIVEVNSRDGGVVILTYGSAEAAARYAANATEIDLSSDLHSAAHFFGEHRKSMASNYAYEARLRAAKYAAKHKMTNEHPRAAARAAD